MHFFVTTDTVGSTRSTDLEVTREQWEAMTEEEQTNLINEHRENVMNSWVEELEQES